MALRNQPEFEQADETVAASNSTVQKEKTVNTTASQAAAAGVAATTAIAKAATGGAVGAVRPNKMVVAFADNKDVFDTSTVSALSMATPRITAEQGSLRVKSRNEKLGTAIRLEVISWNKRWALGCGEDKMNDEMKELFRVSYDNETVDGEDCTVAEYIESLKAQGYPKAKASQYGDLFGYITWTEAKGDIPEDERELVLVQMSVTSLGNFTAFCVSRGLLESRGTVTSNGLVEITAEDRTKGTNSFTNMSFKAVK